MLFREALEQAAKDIQRNQIDFGSTAWHEAKHAAGFMARGHVPLEARCDEPYDVEVGEAVFRRCYGYVRQDPEQAATDAGFDRTKALSILCAWAERPQLPLKGSDGDDPDLLARIVEGRWDSDEAFAELCDDALSLMRSKRFKRLAVAVYQRLVDVEVLDQTALREIYKHEQERSRALQTA